MDTLLYNAINGLHYAEKYWGQSIFAEMYTSGWSIILGWNNLKVGLWNYWISFRGGTCAHSHTRRTCAYMRILAERVLMCILAECVLMRILAERVLMRILAESVRIYAHTRKQCANAHTRRMRRGSETAAAHTGHCTICMDNWQSRLKFNFLTNHYFIL